MARSFYLMLAGVLALAIGLIVHLGGGLLCGQTARPSPPVPDVPFITVPLWIVGTMLIASARNVGGSETTRSVPPKFSNSKFGCKQGDDANALPRRG